jgi:hypothetical protein
MLPTPARPVLAPYASHKAHNVPYAHKLTRTRNREGRLRYHL